jgi:uncharacterized membrane protein (GlpM family)
VLGLKDVGVLAIKAFNGGLFVVAFALLAEVLKPKRFAGLFSAAPSVALANLVVVIATKGHHEAVLNTTGMTVGAVAFLLSAAAAAWWARGRSVRSAMVMLCAAWLAIAIPGYLLFLA